MKPKQFTNTGFLSLVLATLIFLAGLFAFKLSIDEYNAQKERPSAEHHADNEVVNAETTFLGIDAEGWTAIFTCALFVSTTALFGITVGLFKAAVKGSKDAERLFIQDQRPWIQADWNAADLAVITKDKEIVISFDLVIKNIGKSPAYEVTRGWLFLHDDINTLSKYFERTRASIPDRMRYNGETVLPGQEVIRRDLVLQISAAQIEASRSTRCLGTGYVACAMLFRSNLTGSVHEVSRLFMLDIGGGYPLHLVPTLGPKDATVSLTSMPVFNITT